MRAKEFIVEQERDVSGEDYTSLPMPTASIIPNASQNFYHMYRFGLAMSRASDATHDLKTETDLADKLAIIPYSDRDMEIVDRGLKHMGGIAKPISNKGTKEEDGNNTISVIAKPYKNKYGV